MSEKELPVSIEAEREGLKGELTEANATIAHLRKAKDCYYDCVDKSEANQRIARAQEEAMAIARPMVEKAEAERDNFKAILQKVEAWLIDDEGPVWRLYKSGEIGELNGGKRAWKDVLEDLRNSEVDVLAICEGAPWTAVLLYREIWKALNEASVQTPAPVIVHPQEVELIQK